MGAVERDLRDRAADTLEEIEHLDVRPMFSGFGFYVDGLLVAAAWDGAFRLRHRTGAHWIYQPVDDTLLDDPDLLVPLIRHRIAALSALPEARPRRPRRREGTAPGLDDRPTALPGHCGLLAFADGAADARRSQ